MRVASGQQERTGHSPAQSGELSRAVRSVYLKGGEGERVPMVALTAYGRVEDKVQILAAGFDSHVVKPVDLAELSATIRSLITARPFESKSAAF